VKPTDDKCTYTSIDDDAKSPPTIIFGLTAIRWIKALVDNHSEEIGFFGLVDERPNNTFFIREIFYPKHQLVTAGTCEISPEGETQIVTWLCDHNRTEDLGKLRLWGHSHHNMGVSPSGQDETQALERMKQNQAHLIRVIVNKSGMMDVSFFDFTRLIRFDHIKWSTEYQESDVVMNEKLSMITTLLAETDTPAEKLNKISVIIDADPETDKIVEKVKKLKETNVPTSPSSGFVPAWQPGQPQYGRYTEHFSPHHGQYPGMGAFEDDAYGAQFGPYTPSVAAQGVGPHIVTRREFNQIIDRNMTRSNKKSRRERAAERDQHWFQGRGGR
jgi:hypothetical protein